LPSEDKVTPFEVFISSSQREFRRFRETLEIRINNEPFVDQQIMRGVRIEAARGSITSQDIREKIEQCAIYVGIFGHEESAWTFAEFHEAIARDLPVLIYQVIKRRRRGRPSGAATRGRRTNVQIFLDEKVKFRGIRIRGPYSNEDRLEEDIIRDLAFRVADMVREAARVRKSIHKALPLM